MNGRQLPLHVCYPYAIQCDIQYVLGIPVNATQRQSGKTALAKAVALSMWTYVELLLANGADVNVSGVCARTPTIFKDALKKKVAGTGMLQLLLHCGYK